MTLRARVREVLRSKPKTTNERVRFMLVNELHCDPNDIHAAASLFGDLGFDQADFDSLADAIDHEFGLVYPIDVISVCPTIGHLVRWIDRDS